MALSTRPWSRAFPSLLPVAEIGRLQAAATHEARQCERFAAADKIVLERELLANDGRYDEPAITPDAIAVLQYTGGTTGTPKGAMLSSRQSHHQCQIR